MKHPITLRIDTVLLAKAKSVAISENRTLTNFIETLIKRRVSEDNPGGGATTVTSQIERGRRPMVIESMSKSRSRDSNG